MKTARLQEQIIDGIISVVLIIFASLGGYFVSAIMGASSQEKLWSMLYTVTFLGAIAAWVCMLKLVRISNILSNKTNTQA